MKPITLKFVKSAPSVKDLPSDTGREIILAGYSNVGKSSVINLVSNTRDLAKCSKTPGRTQLFNVFETPGGQRVLDLPGYGYAKVPTKLQRSWMDHLSDYLINRASLHGMLVITDIRRELRPIDVDLLTFCQENNVPFAIVLNKSDKLSKSQVLQTQMKLATVLNVKKDLIIPCSCLKRLGVENVIRQIRFWLGL